jgi:hypothetical protein
MKIFITGGTGFIGTTLTKRFIKEGYRVSILTRSPKKQTLLPKEAFLIKGNPIVAGPWQEKLAQSNVVINLAGASIFRYWTKKNKEEIIKSRILTTKHIVEAMANQKRRMHLFNASAIGYYGQKGDEILDEDSPRGDDFLASVAFKWEEEANRAKGYG